MFKISVYGKGGVGKSSVSSNLSYLLSKSGKKVLHVGCDPKHDSTRLLTNGVPQKTFMDSMLDGDEDDVIQKGTEGIACVECGGAEPGIGCAGKGMISMFNYIENNTPEDTDVRICDVLGDVVCGGFSVPMRRNQTDGIIIVVSEDFMSLYAANNILRGIRNLNGTACIIGIVLNSRSPGDRVRVEQFSRATGIPVIGTIEKSQRFSDAEAAGKTVSEMFPESDTCAQLSAVTDHVIAVISGSERRYLPKPLNDNAMTQIAAKQIVTDFDSPKVRTKCGFDSVDRERNMVYKCDMVMPACTSHGAVELLLSVRDAAVVLHGPRNCAFLMEYAWVRRGSLRSNSGADLPPDNLYTTGMNASNVFTGDRTVLRSTVERAVADGFRTVFVVMTCTPDTIGTDVSSALDGIEGARIIPVEPDGYFLGSKFGGFTGALRAMASISDRGMPVEKGKVGLVAFQPGFLSDPVNRKVMDDLLGAFGLHLGVLLTEVVSTKDITEFASCEYFIGLGYGPLTRKMTDIMVPGDRKIMFLDPPVFMTGLEEWCEALSEATGDVESGKRYLTSKRREYEELTADLKDRHSGRRCVFYMDKEVYLKPMIDILAYIGFESVALMSWPQRFERPPRPEHKRNTLPFVPDVNLCELKDRMRELGADFVVSGDPRTGRLDVPWIGVRNRYLGIEGSIEWMQRIDNCTRLRTNQKWKEARR